MKISTKGRYALRMLVDVAQHQSSGTVTLKEIAERQGISKKYLEQIRICNEVLHSCRHSNDIKKLVKGFMIASRRLSAGNCAGKAVRGGNYPRDGRVACAGGVSGSSPE